VEVHIWLFQVGQRCAETSGQTYSDYKFKVVKVAVVHSGPSVMHLMNNDIMGCNSTMIMDIYLWFSLLCYSVYIETLQWADPPSVASYNISEGLIFS
jgi:hypothetical protein